MSTTIYTCSPGGATRSWLVVLQDHAGWETARADSAEAEASDRSQALQQAQQDLAGAQVMLTPDCYAKTQVFVIVCAFMKNRSPLSWSSRITSMGSE